MRFTNPMPNTRIGRVPLVVILAAALVAFVSCGDPTTLRAGPGTADPTPGWLPEDPPPDWDGGIASVTVSSIDEARRALAFTPREPQGLGSPRRIVVGEGPESERQFKPIGFIYDTATYGRVVVKMELDDVSAAVRRAGWSQSVAAPNKRSRSEIVIIRSGTEAIVGVNSAWGFGAISWREGSVLILVMGPTLTRDQAIEIANKL